jgi:hypothetical protein
MMIDIETAAGFDAIAATGTILAPIDAAEFADPMEPAGSWDSLDMVAFWHFI